ncbi:MAG: thermonuclease family protein [Cyclobacteriaceae bacterium]
MKVLVFLLISLFYTGSVDPFVGKVTKVIDGDTIEVLRDGKAIRLRLNGIDAPESGQPYGTKAKEFAASILAGKEVSVVPHSQDRYGRTIADIYLSDGSWFNKTIVAAGFAWHYKQYSKDSELANAEVTASEFKLGLWKDPNPIAPWEWRRGRR